MADGNNLKMATSQAAGEPGDLLTGCNYQYLYANNIV
jgi:hypothetical protein